MNELENSTKARVSKNPSADMACVDKWCNTAEKKNKVLKWRLCRSEKKFSDNKHFSSEFCRALGKKTPPKKCS